MVVGEVLKYVMESVYKDVECDVLVCIEVKDNFKVIVLGGQFGFGKLVLVVEVVCEFCGNGGVVVIDVDWMCEENLCYKQFSKEDLQNVVDCIYKEVGEWVMCFMMVVVEGCCNLVVDGIMCSLENICELINCLKENGYEVEVCVMVVNLEILMICVWFCFEE